MQIRIASAVCVLASGALFLGAPASGQDVEALKGHWIGDVVETLDGEVTRYRMFVSIDTDRRGHPVASVSYSLECRGIWTDATKGDGAWHFEETITAGRTNCASHVDVALSPEGDGLRARLHPVGYAEQLAQTVLRRLP